MLNVVHDHTSSRCIMYLHKTTTRSIRRDCLYDTYCWCRDIDLGICTLHIVVILSHLRFHVIIPLPIPKRLVTVYTLSIMMCDS